VCVIAFVRACACVRACVNSFVTAWVPLSLSLSVLCLCFLCLCLCLYVSVCDFVLCVCVSLCVNICADVSAYHHDVHNPPGTGPSDLSIWSIPGIFCPGKPALQHEGDKGAVHRGARLRGIYQIVLCTVIYNIVIQKQLK
jgi:hypothetical protein